MGKKPGKTDLEYLKRHCPHSHKDAQKAISEYLKLHGFAVFQVGIHGGITIDRFGRKKKNQDAGVPDLLAINTRDIVLAGIARPAFTLGLMIEVKTPNDKPSPEQKAFLESWRSVREVKTGVARSVEDIIALLETPPFCAEPEVK